MLVRLDEVGPNDFWIDSGAGQQRYEPPGQKPLQRRLLPRVESKRYCAQEEEPLRSAMAPTTGNPEVEESKERTRIGQRPSTLRRGGPAPSLYSQRRRAQLAQPSPYLPRDEWDSHSFLPSYYEHVYD